MYLTDQEYSFKVYINRIKDELCSTVYGYINVEYISHEDALKVSIERKDFKYGYVLTNVSSRFSSTPAKDSAQVILAHYNKVIHQWFFK